MAPFGQKTFLSGLVTALTATVWLAWPNLTSEPALSRVTIDIAGTIVEAEIADTETARARGLSGRATLAAGEGMLFVFTAPGLYGFWMKDMNFPIDIVWIGENRQVLGLTRSIAPETYPRLFYPPAAVKYVLELPAGTAGAWQGATLAMGE